MMPFHHRPALIPADQIQGHYSRAYARRRVSVHDWSPSADSNCEHPALEAGASTNWTRGRELVPQERFELITALVLNQVPPTVGLLRHV